jgi:anti-sigma factor RsiW
MTAADSASVVTVPAAQHGRLSSRQRDVCAATPTRLAALFSSELLPDVRDELLEHVDTCMTCKAIEMRMRRAERAFATTVAGALAADETAMLVEPVEPSAYNPAPPPASPEGGGVPEFGPLSAHNLRWVTRLIDTEHAKAYANEPPSRRGSADTGCVATPSRLAARAIGRLRDDQRRELDAHLDGCLRCQATELRILRAERAFATLVASGIAEQRADTGSAREAASTNDGNASVALPEPAVDIPSVDAAVAEGPADDAAAKADNAASSGSTEATEAGPGSESPEGPESVAVVEVHEVAEQTAIREDTATPEEVASSDETATAEDTATPEEAPTARAAHLAAGAAAAAAMAAFMATETPQAAHVADASEIPLPADTPDPADATDVPEPAEALAAAAGGGATDAFQPSRPSATPVGGTGRRPAARSPQRPTRRGRRFTGRDLVLPVAVGVAAIVIAAVLLLGNGSSGTPPKPAATASAGRTAAPARKATPSTATKPTRHRTPSSATHRARHHAATAAPASTPSSPSPGTSAPAASVAPSTPVSTPSAPVTPSPPPAGSQPASGSGTSSVSVTPKGGSLPPATAPTQGIGTGG